MPAKGSIIRRVYDETLTSPVKKCDWKGTVKSILKLLRLESHFEHPWTVKIAQALKSNLKLSCRKIQVISEKTK